MTWVGFVLRALFTLAGLWLTRRLLHGGVTSVTYPWALSGLLAVVLLWLVRPETAGKLSMLGFEIDQRIEAAQQIIARLEKVEADARQATKELADMADRETLRPFAMVEYSGRRALAEGGVSVSGGELELLHGAIFHQSGDTVTWDCTDDVIAKLSQVIEKFPKVPYAMMARATCLKQRGDAAWRRDAEQCIALAVKIKRIEPHSSAYDDVHARCEELLR